MKNGLKLILYIFNHNKLAISQIKKLFICIYLNQQHSRKSKCEVCQFEYQYNLDWGKYKKVDHVQASDFIYYFIKTLSNGAIKSVRVIFVISLWFLLFVGNTVLISPFLPTHLLQTIFQHTQTTTSNKSITPNVGGLNINNNSIITSNDDNNGTQLELGFFGQKFFTNGQITAHTILLCIVLGAFAQVILFVALCVFEFHQRHRDGNMGFVEHDDDIQQFNENNQDDNDQDVDLEQDQEAEDDVPEVQDNEDNVEEDADGLGFDVAPPGEEPGFLNVCNYMLIDGFFSCFIIFYIVLLMMSYTA